MLAFFQTSVAVFVVVVVVFSPLAYLLIFFCQKPDTVYKTIGSEINVSLLPGFAFVWLGIGLYLMFAAAAQVRNFKFLYVPVPCFSLSSVFGLPWENCSVGRTMSFNYDPVITLDPCWYGDKIWGKQVSYNLIIKSQFFSAPFPGMWLSQGFLSFPLRDTRKSRLESSGKCPFLRCLGGSVG